MIPYPAVILAIAMVAGAAWLFSRGDSGNADNGDSLFGPDPTSPAATRAANADKTGAGAGANTTALAWRAGVIDAANTSQIAFDALLAAAPGYRLAETYVNAAFALAETGTKAALTAATRGENPLISMRRGALDQKALFITTWQTFRSAIAARDS